MTNENSALEVEAIIKSTDIYNLLANLYFICARDFTTLHDYIKKDSREKKIQNHLLFFKDQFSKIINKQSIFEADFQEIIGILKANITNRDDYLIISWAFLKALDLTIFESTEYLNIIEPIWCRASDFFERKKYRLLFKPSNLIFDEIKDKSEGDRLKSGIDIGQRIEDQLQKIIMYEEHHSRKIEFNPIDEKVNGLLTSQGTDIAFAVAPIYYDFQYSFKRIENSDGVPEDSDGVSYIFDEIKNRQKIQNYIGDILQRCIDENVHIVVFPELAIDEQLRGYISDWLKKYNEEQKIIMVIAGSYHILKDRDKEVYENSCITYRFDGKKLWEQKKMNQFHLDETDINQIKSDLAKGLQDFKKLFKEEDRKAWEHIKISDTLVLYDTPIGRMAVTICLDFIVREKDKLLLEPHANIIFVPTMSSSLKKMKQANEHLGNFGAASVFCANNCWIVTGGEINKFNPALASYVYIPSQNGLKRLKCNSKCHDSQCDLEIFRLSQIFK